MTRLLALFVLLAVAVVVSMVHAGTAQAAFSCSHGLGTPVYTALGATLQESWGAQCYGAQWRAEFGVQYKVDGVWHTAGCANTNPCYIRRPAESGTWYTNGSTEHGFVNFAVLNQCVKYRVMMTLTSRGAVELGPYPSVQSVCQ